MTRLTIVVVDPVLAERGRIAGLLGHDADVDIVGFAANGREAVRAAALLKPAAIVMNLQLPVLSSVEASRRIMQETPTPIVLIVDDATPDWQRLSFAALEAGALVTVAKPGRADPRRTAELLRTVKAMAQVKLVRRRPPAGLATGPSTAPQSSAAAASTAPRPAAPLPTRRPELIAIGASTGGPQVVCQLLADLPADFPVPLLVVQHIAVGFVAGMVSWLRTQCAVPVDVAGDGKPIIAPGAYLAPSGQHLVVRGRAMALTDDPEVSGHRPSATVLFRSLAPQYGAATVGIVLTGMGDDGAAGLRELKRVGALTVAQDEASCAVFGMPAAAIGLGVVDHVLAPEAIGRLLLALADGKAEA